MKQYYLLFVLFFLISCTKDKQKYILTENDLKVREILHPGMMSTLIVNVEYINNQIDNITRKHELGNTGGLIDSIKFFYTNLTIDSALLYKKYENDSYLLKFNWLNSDLRSIEKISKKNNSSYFIEFNYYDKRLTTINSKFFIDSITYNDKGLIVMNKLYKRYDVNENFSLNFQENIKTYYDYYNPYYLISRKLNFPYFTINNDPFFSKMSDIVKKSYFNESYIYKLDDYNRVIAITDLGLPSFTTEVKYK